MQTPNHERMPRPERPSLLRAGIVFGVALLGSLAIGVGLRTVDDSTEPASGRTSVGTTKSASVTGAAPAASARRVSAARTSGRPRAVPAIVSAPAKPIAPAPAKPTAPEASAVLPRATTAEAAPAPVSFGDAEAAYHAGRFEEAARGFEQYSNQNPANPWGHYMNGLARKRLGELDAAEASLRRTIDILPGLAKARVNLARVLLDAGRPEDAETEAREAIDVDGASASAQRVLGRALHSLGRADEATDAYRAAIALDPQDAWSHNNLGFVHIEAERFDEALPLLERACELDGSVAVFRNNLGVALERTGNLTGAAKAWADALALDPGHEKARVSLARAEALGAGSGGEAATVVVDAGETNALAVDPTLEPTVDPAAADPAVVGTAGDKIVAILPGAAGPGH